MGSHSEGRRTVGMQCAPPLRFGAQPLVGKKAKHQQTFHSIRECIPARAKRKNVGRVDRKVTVQGCLRMGRQSVQESSQPLARQGSRYRPFFLASKCDTQPLKLRPMQKQKLGSIRRLPQLAAQKAAQVTTSSKCRAQVTQGSQAASRKRKQSHPNCAEWRRMFDGSMSEAQHLQYHSGYKGFCIRCDVQKRRKVYDACSWHAGRSWLSARVSRGLWGLGCADCAAYLASGRKLDGARFSKFARFQVRPKSGFVARGLIEQHHRSESHRVASGLSRFKSVTRNQSHVITLPLQPQPLACRASSSTETLGMLSAEDVALLKGNVPSPAEWKDAFAVLSENLALRKIGRIDEKRTGASAVENRKRKRYRQQLRVMAEATRRKIRRVLFRATSITLALDECKYRKIVRFRVDLPSRKSSEPGTLWRHVGASGFSYSGVLGLLDCSKKHASDFEEDHAVTAVKQLDAFLTKFCSPLGRVRGRRGVQRLECDQYLKAHVLKTVKVLSADGAAKERRAVFLAARELFVNLLIVIRDPAHAIRLAIKSLHCDDVYGQVWHDLFDAEHALVPNLMNSSKWHNLLVAIQEDNIRAVAMPGVPQPLAGVIRNVAFAKQRFDSTAGPVGKIALMLLPVATLLAYIASDKRHELDQRERATSLLQKLDTKFCLAIGVSADWGIICNWFLRLFDVHCWP